MKKRWAEDDAVSPVIATILMVAITVVLAAVLYVMVIGMQSDTPPTELPVGMVQQSRDDTTITLLIASAPNTALIDGSSLSITSEGTPNPVTAMIYNPNGTVAGNFANNTWSGLANNNVKFVNGMQIVITASKIQNGDRIVMTGIGYGTSVVTIN